MDEILKKMYRLKTIVEDVSDRIDRLSDLSELLYSDSSYEEELDEFIKLFDVEDEEYDFIFDRKSKVTSSQRLRFLIELKKTKDSFSAQDHLDEEAIGDKYYAAFAFAKKVVLERDEDTFRQFSEDATNPNNFAKPFNEYCDSLETYTNIWPTASVEEKSEKKVMKIMEKIIV